VLTAAAITGGIWMILDAGKALGVVIAMLVVTCPCALSLAAPTVFSVALGRLARRGVLLRSSRALERISDVDHWLLDKTGTLTHGRVSLVATETLGELDAQTCLTIAAALEAGIDHPLARALGGDSAVPRARDVGYVLGYGVIGTVNGRRYELGSARLVGAEAEAADAGQCVFLSADNSLLARFDLSDTLRPHARSALTRLAERGATLSLSSGDHPGTVAAIARELGIDEYLADQTPVNKLDTLRALQSGGHVVGVIGDGVNDAPVLAQADVSIAMLDGSRLAQASADVIFIGEDLRLLARLPQWADATRRVVRQNLLWAAAYNAAAVPLAAFGHLAPWMAAIGMSLSSLLVVGNALRLGWVLNAENRQPSPEPARQLQPSSAS
jgi:Cu2+-exporting ATPase